MNFKNITECGVQILPFPTANPRTVLLALMTSTEQSRSHFVFHSVYPQKYSGHLTTTNVYHTTTTTTVLRPFFRDHMDEPAPEENFWTLWCKQRLREADTSTIRLGALHPD